MFPCSQDPSKVVHSIVDNVTKAYPAFCNPVGRGCWLSWVAMNSTPQPLLSWGQGLFNALWGFGPIPEVVREMQG
ncbi:hypothetical protein B484DRAFT_415984 [Ochromonadaceae sp. CCMP2298]|nr:hypothetical protein B484DRAFT_415984 [Ochromonadaceae sp. CCMP2298]